ncbi:MAG: zinc ribbon domain-containing protein [Deltaproteobacteria bacterium]|nr:zinc ribbon domain-containing protein [Deltaproteobacteria bacterium]
MSACPHCEVQVSPADVFCKSCGARLVRGGGPQQAPGAGPEPDLEEDGSAARGPSTKLVLVLLLDLCLLGASAALVYATLSRFRPSSGTGGATGPADAAEVRAPRDAGVADAARARPDGHLRDAARRWDLRSVRGRGKGGGRRVGPDPLPLPLDGNRLDAAGPVGAADAAPPVAVDAAAPSTSPDAAGSSGLVPALRSPVRR